MFRASNILSRHRSELVARCQFRCEHLGKCGRQPYVPRISGNVSETHHGNRPACEAGGNDQRRLRLRLWHMLISAPMTIPSIGDKQNEEQNEERNQDEDWRSPVWPTAILYRRHGRKLVGGRVALREFSGFRHCGALLHFIGRPESPIQR